MKLKVNKSKLVKVIDEINLLSETPDVKFENETNVTCPHCESIDCVGNGKYKDRKRYKCKSCGKSFNELTGTVCSYIQNRDKFASFSKELPNGRSLRKLAADYNISLNTALIWKHKILNEMQSLQAEKSNY